MLALGLSTPTTASNFCRVTIVLQSALAAEADFVEGSGALREIAFPVSDGWVVSVPGETPPSQSPLMVITGASGARSEPETGDDVAWLSFVPSVFFGPASGVCPRDSVENRRTASHRYCIPVISPRFIVK